MLLTGKTRVLCHCPIGSWQSLDKCIRGIPQRELLIAGGDLSTQVSPVPPFVGRGTGMLSKDRAPDGEELTNLLRTNRIALLNTWAARQEAAHTFRFGRHSAQLDYVMVRQKDANQQARQAQAIRNCPLGAWHHAACRFRLPYVKKSHPLDDRKSRCRG